MARTVIVVGGGVMGSSAAWQLASRGAEVTLLEQFTPGHGLGSSHGSSRIFRLAYADPFYVALAVRALPLWRRLEEEADTGVLTLTGAVDHGPAAATQALRVALATAGRPFEPLVPAQVAERWPGLRAESTALFHPEAGRVHAEHAVTAFQRAARRRGATVRHGVKAVAVRPRGESAEVATSDGAALTADAVVVAVGGWAPAVLPRLVPRVPRLRVTLEQPAHFPAADPLSWPSFIHHGGQALDVAGGVYGLGSADGVKAGFHGIGPVIDPDHGERTADPARLAVLRDYARRWLPGADADRAEATTCLYTTTPDHDFVIDRTGPITVLAGFSGHGFKFAPVIGELAADLVDGGPGARRFALVRPPD
jgi:sarcosine oxidase